MKKKNRERNRTLDICNITENLQRKICCDVLIMESKYRNLTRM